MYHITKTHLNIKSWHLKIWFDRFKLIAIWQRYGIYYLVSDCAVILRDHVDDLINIYAIIVPEKRKIVHNRLLLVCYNIHIVFTYTVYLSVNIDYFFTQLGPIISINKVTCRAWIRFNQVVCLIMYLSIITSRVQNVLKSSISTESF